MQKLHNGNDGRGNAVTALGIIVSRLDYHSPRA